MTIFDNVRDVPPCTACGSRTIKKNDLKADWVRGRWKGKWTCENGHENTVG
jgi:hypothetical protein